MSNRKTQWIIEPAGSNRGHANEVIAKYLLSIGKLENNDMDFKDSDGIRRLGYLVDYDVISYLNGSQEFLYINFYVFSQEGGGKWRRNELHEKPRKNTKKDKVKKATEFKPK